MKTPDSQGRSAEIELPGLLGEIGSPALEDAVALVAQLLATPLALVSLAGPAAHRVCAATGLPEGFVTPAKLSFCSQVIADRKPLVVKDAAADPRFAADELVCGPLAAKACLGAPLVLSDGTPIGTLCAIDRVARAFSPDQVCLLEKLARMTSALLESEMNSRRLAVLGARTRSDLQAILDHVPAQVASWNRDGTCRFANRQAAESYSQPSRDIVGRTLAELVGPQRWESARPQFEAALQGRKSLVELIDELPNGRRRYRQVEWIPDRSNAPAERVYTVVSDVTAIREFSERIRQLAQRVETVREQERRSLALILHEGIAQDLTAIRLMGEPLRVAVMKIPWLVPQTVTLVNAVELCIEDIRRLALGLQPVGLGSDRIADSIRRLANDICGEAGISVEVHDQLGDRELDIHARALMFRVAEEALRNIAQHSGAHRAQVRVYGVADLLHLEVEDDGRGLSAEALEKPGSLGLLGLQERCRAADGVVQVRSGESGGTMLTLTLPWQPVRTLG